MQIYNDPKEFLIANTINKLMIFREDKDDLLLIKNFKLDLNIECIKYKFDQVFLLGNPFISRKSVFCSIFYFHKKEIFKQIKLRSTDNQFAAQIETNFEIVRDAEGNHIIMGIDSVSCHYVIMENVNTKQVNISGYVYDVLNTIAWDGSMQRVIVAGASNGISAFFMKDPDEIAKIYKSGNFEEIYSIKIVKQDGFLIVSGDKNLLEIVNLKVNKMVMKISVCTDISLFKLFYKKLYFYDDVNYNTVCVSL